MSTHDRWNGPMIQTKKLDLPWLENSYVGHMQLDVSFNKVNDGFIKGGMNTIKVRYITRRKLLRNNQI